MSVSAPGPVAGPARDELDPALRRVEELAIAAVNENALPGLGIGVVRDGRVVYLRGFGVADAEAKHPVTPDTVFRTGSIGKTFTAIALMQLWEQGRFSLDDPVNRYLKRFRIEAPGHRGGSADGAARPVTFKHLLTHTAGLGELRTLTDLVRPVIGLGAKAGAPLPPLGDYYAPALRAEVPAGTKWAYANHGFATLGQLVEDISGQPFADYMAEHVFAPLGLDHTDFRRGERVRERFARAYQLKGSRLKPVPDYEVIPSPAGSSYASVRDLADYVAALLGGGRNAHGQVLKPETLRLMLSPHYQLDPRLAAMGLAFLLDSYDGHRVAGHDGGWPGYVASMLFAPDDGVGVVAFANTSTSALGKLTPAVLRHLLDLPDPAKRLPRPDVVERIDLWPELCGFYGPTPGLLTNLRLWFGLGGEVEVFVKEGHLAMRAFSPVAGALRSGLRLYPVDPEDPLSFQVIYEDATYPVVFRRSATGAVDALLGFPPLTVLHKRPALESLRVRTALAGAGLVAGGVAAAALTAWRRRRS